MRLSTKGRYAVMAMADIGLHGREKPVALADIAVRQGLSLSYLEQLFAKLRRAGLVHSIRGPRGGYVLACSPEQTTISDIVAAAEENLRVTRCKGEHASKGCMPSGIRCITHDLWEELGNHIQRYLTTVTIADVLNRHDRPGGSHAASLSALCVQEIA